jgi:uncharacterized protein (DUF4415 family)
MTKSDIKTFSLSELQAKNAAGDFVTTTETADAGENLDAAFWSKAQVAMPSEHPKVGISLRVDSEVYEWFRGTGKGYLSRMNAVLKAYVDTQAQPRPK